jgi:ketosteroid isomerase-like protein
MTRRMMALGLVLVLNAAAHAADPAEEAVRKAQADRFAALIKGDFDAVAGMLSDDLIYTHSNSKVETKAELLQLLKSGHYQYRSIVPKDVVVRMYGDTAVANGLGDVEVITGGQPLSLKLRFIEVWVKQGGRFKLAAWQSTRLPAAQ